MTNAGWKTSQKGVMDVGLCDHQLIYFTHTILRTKVNIHNQIRVWSLKKYTSYLLMKELKKINFLDYNIFSKYCILRSRGKNLKRGRENRNFQRSNNQEQHPRLIR